jgi:hypothetical protein
VHIANYLAQLEALADAKAIDLRDAFAAAGVPSSTYYRAKRETTQLSYGTAVKVAGVLAEASGPTQEGA